MLEKISKYFANRAADGAVEGVKSSVNEKVDKYGDVIMAGLALGIIIIGSRHIAKQNQPNLYSGNMTGLPYSGTPIVINNYYQDSYSKRTNERGGRTYEQRAIQYLPGQQRQMDPRSKNRR